MEKAQVDLDSDPTANHQLHALTSVLLARAELLAYMGKSFGTQRDIFSSLGYELVPSFTSYWWRYKRTSIGKRIIKAYPQACWRNPPQVWETKDSSQTAFEVAWEQMVKAFRLWHIFRRLDVLTGIGTYGILYMGFNGQDLLQPVSLGEKLVYLRPFTSDAAQIGQYVMDTTDPRYGLPRTYKIQMDGVMGSSIGRGSSMGASGMTKEIHYTRVLHVAEDIEEGEIHGTPRLEACLNDLQSLDYVVGGSGEMFWRGAFPGHAFVAKDGVQLPTDTTRKEAMQEEIGRYVHGFQRYMKLTGVDIHDFPTQAVSPKDHYEVLMSNISTATNIPKRILMGSERGELASSQDRDNWGEQVRDRQANFCEPFTLRAFIDRMIETGQLPEPKEYSVFWPPLTSPSGAEQATVAKAVAEALNTYASGPAEAVMPLSEYLKRWLGFTGEEVEDLEKILKETPWEPRQMESEPEPKPLPKQEID